MRPSTSSTRSHSGFRSSLRSQARISCTSTGRSLPKAAAKSAATASASSSRSSLSGDELIERLGQIQQVRQLARRLRSFTRLFAEAVDPDADEAELVRRDDVVEERRGDVDVAPTVGAQAGEELVPVL